MYDENLIGFFDSGVRKKALKKSGLIESTKNFDHKTHILEYLKEYN